MTTRCVHFDSCGVVVSATADFAALVGASPGDLIGAPIARWWPGSDADARVRDTGVPERDVRDIELAGETRSVVEERFPRVDERGEVCGVLLVVREVAGDRPETDTAAHMASVVAAAPDAIFVFDREGRYLDVISDGGSRSSDPPAALRGRKVREVLPGAADAIEATLIRTIESGEVQELEYEVPAPAGERRFAARAVAVRRSPDSPVIWVTRDITHRRRAEQTRRLFEQQIAEAQRLESLSLLAGGIANDFNNLLVSILANANYARIQGAAGAGDECLCDIEAAASRAADLCRQLLAYTGGTRLVTGPVELNGLVREATAALRDTVSGSIELSLRLGGDMIMVDCDRSHIRHVIRDLIVNACEAIEGAGQIVISTETREVSSDELSRSRADALISEGRYSVIEVADSGRGMAADLAERACEPFFSTKFRGRGLGLASAVGIMRAHHGAIVLDSVPGAGSSVRLYLPEYPRPPVTAGSSPERAQARPTILLVDDDELIRKVARRILESVEYAVITAADGAEGIERYRDASVAIDCVIMDLTMPVLDGGEAARQIRAIDDSVPLILSSGYAENEYTAVIGRDPRMWFLQKPYRANQLVYAVREALRSSSVSPARTG